MRPSTVDVIDCARRLRAAWSDAEVRVDAYLPGGYSHDNYRLTVDGDVFVLRYGVAAAPNHRYDQELALWHGLPEGCAPELIAFDADTGAMLTRWVEGDLLADRLASVDELVGYLHRLHSAIPPINWRYDLGARVDAWLGATTPSRVVSAARRLAADADDARMRACHNDLNPWNVIASDLGWITLDWEMTGRNDPLFDVAALGFGVGLSRTEVRQLCLLYDSSATELQVQMADSAFWLREFAWADHFLRSRGERAEVVEQRALALSSLEELV